MGNEIGTASKVGKSNGDNNVAIVGIIVSDNAAADELNAILHDFSDSVVGRLGVPYRERGINVISIIVDATNDKINSLSGKIGKLPGVSAKVMYAKGLND